jgi:hypothetical protein
MRRGTSTSIRPRKVQPTLSRGIAQHARRLRGHALPQDRAVAAGANRHEVASRGRGQDEHVPDDGLPDVGIVARRDAERECQRRRRLGGGGGGAQQQLDDGE